LLSLTSTTFFTAAPCKRVKNHSADVFVKPIVKMVAVLVSLLEATPTEP
jgi:hypothetical protein